MKIQFTSLRFGLLAGVAASLALHPVLPLHADDHGGGNGGHHGGDDSGGDDPGHQGGDDGSGASHPEDLGKTEFLGTIQALPATADLTGAWTVDGRAVTVDAATLIRTEHGAPTVGGKVEVEGALQADGSSVLASVVKTEDAAMEREDNVFFGTILALPDAGTIGVWQISGLTVLVSDATRVETEAGTPAVGLTVRVEGVQQADGSIVASEIQIQAELAATTAAPADNKIKLKGVIQQLPATPGSQGNWLIDNVIVTVTADSVRQTGSRKAKIGRHIVVKGLKQVNGSVLAARIIVRK